MKKFSIQVILLVLVIGAGVFLFNPADPFQNINLPFTPEKEELAVVKINEATISAEIADTASKRSKGLGGRQSLGENSGMLFIFERLDKYPFWMKGLSFPLDFIWIKDNQVVEVLENVQPPALGETDANLPIYTSSVEVDKVLEVNAGTVKRLNIKTGDTVVVE